eukprot:7164905-Alexandrium_andersonii.AAC.1
MSASLVGSEMCIRDRPPKPPGGTAMHLRLTGANSHQPGRAAAGRVRRAPVSYTHLTLPTICSV